MISVISDKTKLFADNTKLWSLIIKKGSLSVLSDNTKMFSTI